LKKTEENELAVNEADGDEGEIGDGDAGNDALDEAW
jgi:hypothetical protein